MTFDLIEITQTLGRRWRFILLLAAATVIVGVLATVLRQKKYKSVTQFFVASPFYSDRHNIFRTDRGQFVDFFGSESDIDKVMAIAQSENAKAEIIRNTGLPQFHNIDTGSRADLLRLADDFNHSYKVKRTALQHMEISYTDPNADVAAAVANEACRVSNRIFSDYFNILRGNVVSSLQSKMAELDSSIESMTDTLARARERYGIYNIVSPGRQTIISGNVANAGGGRGIEEVQNLEAIKDQLVMDRAKCLSLSNEFTTGTHSGQLPLVQVISEAYPAGTPEGLGIPLTIVACLLGGLFFAALWVLLMAYVVDLRREAAGRKSAGSAAA